jgi:hypothetical protein
MSAQIRYRTLVRNIGRIYAAPKDSRMDLLQTGLDEIVAIVGPNSSDAWNTVGADSERLLKVWVAKEEDPAAIEVAQQLTDILWELAAEEKEKAKPASEPVSPAAPPQLIIKESPTAPMNTPAPPRQPDTISHIQPFSLAAVAPPSPILASTVAVEKTVVVDLETVEVDESDSEAPDQLEEADEGEDSASEASSVAAEDEDEGEAEEVEEEVVEPAADEEEEEGMSVEQITIRGRTYWRDTDTDDLYAVVGEDDVGDKVGQIVNGVARFLPLKK